MPNEQAAAVLEVIHRMRAVRIYEPEPVPEADLRTILRAGTMAGSSGNTQPWELVLVTAPELKLALKEIALEGLRSVAAVRAQSPEQLLDSTGRSVTGHAAMESLEDVPVIVMIFWNPDRGVRFHEEYFANDDGTLREGPGSRFHTRGSSIYPLCQNMQVAAHALGYGSLMQTGWVLHQDAIKALLGVPPRMFLEAAVLFGKSAEQLGRPRRRPLEELTHVNGWGALLPPSAAAD
jgi:nitroreductase